MNKTKPIKEHIIPIDEEKTYHRVLYSIGQLDDCDSWPLFKKQQRREDRIYEDMDKDTYMRYSSRSSENKLVSPVLDELAAKNILHPNLIKADIIKKPKRR